MLFAFKKAMRKSPLAPLSSTVFFTDLSTQHWAYDAVHQTLDLLPARSDSRYGSRDPLTFREAREVLEALKKLSL
jgi:hypothetical protein